MIDLICYMAFTAITRWTRSGVPGSLFLLEETKMGSKTQKTEIIRHRKHAPNKVNRKAEQKQVRAEFGPVSETGK